MVAPQPNITFETFWNETKTEELGELEAKFLGFDPCMAYEPLNTATLKRMRLKIRRDGGDKQIRTYEV
jgi:hypothetical protein